MGTALAATFSSTRVTRLVPGIGAMSSPLVRSQASAACAGVAPPSAWLGGYDRIGGEGLAPPLESPAPHGALNGI